MSDYTPSMEEVREQYWAATGDPRRGSAPWDEFDRAIAAHDAKVRADALEEFAHVLRAAVGPVVKHSDGSGGVFEFSPKGTAMEFWSYGNAVAYSGAVVEVLRMLDPETTFERAKTYSGGREKARTMEEALRSATAIRAVPANTNTDPELSDSERGN